MEPVFWRVNQSINFTLEFYEISRIKNYLDYFCQNPKEDDKGHYLISWLELIPIIHQRMKDEIQQTIYTTNQNTIADLFDLLKLAANDNRIYSLDTTLIEHSIEEYNTKTAIIFEDKVKVDVNRYKSNPNFYTNNGEERKDGEEYEIDNKYLYGLLGNSTWHFPATTKEKYRRIYCIEDKADFIDTLYLDRYLSMVQSIIESFKNIVNHFIKRYDEGRIHATTTILISNTPVIPSGIETPQSVLLNEAQTPLSMPTNTAEERLKLKMNLSSTQILYLFKSLSARGLFENSLKIIDICKFIAANISTKETETLSATSLSKKWNDIPVNDIAFWVSEFIEMHNQSKKDNPINIKYKPNKTK